MYFVPTETLKHILWKGCDINVAVSIISHKSKSISKESPKGTWTFLVMKSINYHSIFITNPIGIKIVFSYSETCA